jgi:hypothetical protein
VLRVTDGELERVHLDVHVLELEDGRLIFLRRREVRGDGETLAAEEHIREARVLELREAGLLAEPERDVTHVGLALSADVIDEEAMKPRQDAMYLAESKRELVVRLVADSLVRREPKEVVRIHADQVREEVAAGEREVLNDHVHRIVGVSRSGRRASA